MDTMCSSPIGFKVQEPRLGGCIARAEDIDPDFDHLALENGFLEKNTSAGQ